MEATGRPTSLAQEASRSTFRSAVCVWCLWALSPSRKAVGSLSLSPKAPAMASRRGAPPLSLRLRRLLRSPISRCACFIVALTVLLVVLSLRQIARVDLPRPDLPHQARFLMLPLHLCVCQYCFPRTSLCVRLRFSMRCRSCLHKFLYPLVISSHFL